MVKASANSSRTSAKRQMVAAKAFHLFAELGYDKVSFADISKATGVPRTAIYRYFRTKRDIFDAAILGVILDVRAQNRRVREERIPAAARLEKVCALIVDRLYAERDFVSVLFGFIFSKLAAGEKMANRVIEFTEGLKTTFSELITEGTQDGSIREGTDATVASELLFSNMESTALKMLVGIEKDGTAAKARLKVAIGFIST